MSFVPKLNRRFNKVVLAAAALTATMGLSACNDGYGYGGVGLGYNSAAWDPYYGGYTGDPYWGWNNDYYYPGTGYYVFDRSNRRYRWNAQQRGYWQGRSQGWRGAHREIRPMWRDYGVRGGPGIGGRGSFGGRSGFGGRGSFGGRGGFGGHGGGHPGGGRGHR